MEIEAKYAVIGPIDPDQINSLDLEPYHLRPDEDKVHRDEAFDTPRRTISRSGHGLRIRRVDGKAILTLKGAGQYADGIHEREEVEIELDNSQHAPAQWPSPIAERVQALIGDEQVQPLFSIEVRRRTWAVERDGQVIGELAYDEGTITANGRTEAILEIEVEIKGNGARADIERIGKKLLEVLPLRPEARTKRQRGMMLLDSGA